MSDPLLSRVLAWARAHHVTVYVVGGLVRDALLRRRRPSLNVDLAIPAGALRVAKLLAAHLGGAYICLDDAAGSARIVLSTDEARVELDISDFRGPTIEEDLARRDFTVNAMAVPLDVWCTQDNLATGLIDPLGGRQDLSDKRLRACFAQTFLEDAVRILRAFRFSVELDCTLDPSLAPLMQEAAPRLAAIAGERVRDELMAILQTDRAHWALRGLNDLGVLDVLFPELAPGRGVAQGGYHHLDVLDHQLETVAQCDRMMADYAEFAPQLRQPLQAYVESELVERRSRKALIKLGGLFHDVGKPATRRTKPDGEIWFIGHEQFGADLVESVTERLRLSNREAELIRHLVLYHLRPGHLSREAELTRRAIFRFFRDLGDDGPCCLLMWWADRLATRGPISRLDQIDQQRARLEELLCAYFFKAEEVVRPPRLIDGHALMTELGLSPGPLIGTLLQEIAEAQADGQLRSKEDALALARVLLKQHG